MKKCFILYFIDKSDRIIMGENKITYSVFQHIVYALTKITSPYGTA
jgi:hypothetical protein